MKELLANLPAQTNLQLYQQIELGEVATISTGCQYSQHEWPQDDMEAFTVIERLNDLEIILSKTRYIRVSERERSNYNFKKGDIVFQHSTSSSQLGKSILFDLNDTVLHTKYLRIRPNQDLNSHFLLMVLNNYRAQKILHSIAVERLNVSTIGVNALKRLKIPFPVFEEQLSIVQLFEKQCSCNLIKTPGYLSAFYNKRS